MGVVPEGQNRFRNRSASACACISETKGALNLDRFIRFPQLLLIFSANSRISFSVGFWPRIVLKKTGNIFTTS